MIAISVVIPTFNRAKTIGYCLASVLGQTYPISEVIVVDDSSTDNTVETVQAINDARIRCVVLTKNAGAQAARNCGIRESSSEWIAFQDSDDEWLPNKLERQIEALKRTSFDPFTVVHSDCWSYAVTNSKRKLCKTMSVSGEKPFRQLLLSSGPTFPSILTSRLALEQIGYLDEKVPSYQEWDTSIRLAKVCKFFHISDPLFIYHLHSGDTISKDKLRDINGYQYIVEKYRDEIIHEWGMKAFEDHLFFNAYKASCWGLYDEANAILAKSQLSSLRCNFLKYLNRNQIKIKKCEMFIGLLHFFHRVTRRKLQI